MYEGDVLSGGAGDSEEVEDLLMLDLTHEEIKAAFRLFDDSGEGFITVMRFRVMRTLSSYNLTSTNFQFRSF